MGILTAFAALLLMQTPGAARSGDGVVAGQLRKPDGTPAVGVRIGVVSTEETSGAVESLMSIAQTDREGHYRLEQVPPGRYFLMAGPLNGAVYFPGVASRDGAAVITVADGRPIGPLDFKLGFSVTGQILNENGGTIGNEPGNLRLEDSRGAKAEVHQSQDGRFELRYLWPGQYWLVVGSTRVADFTISDKDIEGIQVRIPKFRVEGKSQRPGFESNSAEMRLVEIKTENGELLPEANAPGVGSDTVLAGGAPQLVARNEPFGLLTAWPVATGGQPIVRFAGQYYFQRLRRVEYWIAMSALPQGWYVKSMTYGGVDLTTAPLQVTADPNPAPILVTLTSTRPASAPNVFEVRGRVTNLTPNVKTDSSRVTIQRTSLQDGIVGHAYETRVQPGGTFKFQGIPPGAYTLGLEMVRGMMLPVTQNIVVTDRDITTIEISSSAALPLSILGCAANSPDVFRRCFDTQRRMPLEGVVKEFKGNTPSLLVVVTVTDDKGTRNVELAVTPGVGPRDRKASVGESLKVIVYPRMDGGEGGRIVFFVGPDGKEVGVWSTAEGAVSTAPTVSPITTVNPGRPARIHSYMNSAAGYAASVDCGHVPRDQAVKVVTCVEKAISEKATFLASFAQPGGEAQIVALIARGGAISLSLYNDGFPAGGRACPSPKLTVTEGVVRIDCGP